MRESETASGIGLAFLAAALACAALAGCARPAPQPARESIAGLPGESARHLYARIVTRACRNTEDDEVVLAVVAMLDACRAAFPERRDECESSVCDAIAAPTVESHPERHPAHAYLRPPVLGPSPGWRRYIRRARA